MAIFTAIGTWLTATFGSFLAGVIANLAIGAALIGAQALLTGSQQRPVSSTPQAQAVINQAAGSRVRGYGRAKLGGKRAFFDSKAGLLYQIIMAHHGTVDAFEQFYIGDTPVSLVDAAVTTAPFIGYAVIEPHFGYTDQASSTAMLTGWPGVWTAQHQLRGIAYWIVRFGSPASDKFNAVFPDGYNTPVTCICRLSPVWDPRDVSQDPEDETTWTWSDTAALCILDYLRHKDGYRRALADIDISSFIAKADIDEQQIPLVGGGAEKRYRIWGIYSLDDDPQDVMAKMRAASDAEFYQTPEGKIAIRGGVWSSTAVTLRDNDILGHSMEQGNNLFAAFNELQILYTSADHDFQTTEATSWIDLADQEMRGPMPTSLQLDMVPSASQARRLAKIHRAKSNPAWKGTISANMAALNALGERALRIVLPELAIDDAFFIAGFSLRTDMTGVDLSLMSISQEAYSWDPASEELQSPAVPQDTRPDTSLPIPQNLTLTKPFSDAVQASVSDPGRDDLDLEAEIRAGAGAIWQSMQVTPGALTALYRPLAAGAYQVRARWRGQLETVSDWTANADITL